MSQSLVKLALTALAASVLLSGRVAWSQDDAPAPVAPEERAEAAGEAPADETEPAGTEAGDDRGGPAVGLDEIPELDEQTYEDDDDDFIPSEEIPVDQSIPFPTDI